MTTTDILAALHSALDQRKHANQFRTRRIIEPIDATHIRIGSSTYINFASNNYLALTHHPALISASTSATTQFGTGAAASSLITGYTPLHAAAESSLASWKKSDRALLFPSGYQANHAAIQTISAIADATNKPLRFLLDKLCHASLIDAVRATGKPFRIFPHNHLPKLERLLAEADPTELQSVITESIFSMDGDSADLPALAQLKSKYPFLLLLDEAHATGVYGPHGAGLAAELNLSHLADLTTLTLSKSLASQGGVICASSAWCDAILNFGRASLYTTNIPPSIAATAIAALDILRTEPTRQHRLRLIAKQFRADLTNIGFTLPPGDSPIIPLILLSEQSALNAADTLLSQGLLTIPVRPPTVPPNTSRLRLTLSSAHTDQEISQLLSALKNLPR
ncbi:MAG TPA: 8-amino-7-oxononanoate synthase [Tepidisphaeraceae bacterium]|nr:8-amino-7-oxononanoate synthase [Tepidisphaeraceae bacterium]